MLWRLSGLFRRQFFGLKIILAMLKMLFFYIDISQNTYVDHFEATRNHSPSAEASGEKKLCAIF